MNSTRFDRSFLALLALAATTVAFPAAAETPLTAVEHRVVGVSLVASPTTLAVPKGIKGSLLVDLVPGDDSIGTFGLQDGGHIEGTLRGPSFPARKIYGIPGEPLRLPPLAVSGEYSLNDIKLVDTDTGATRMQATPSTVPITVFDDILVSTVVSRPLTLDEIQDRGIVIDESNFQVTEFEVGLVLDGQSFPIAFPVVSPTFNSATELIPAAELENRLVEAADINAGVAVELPDELKRLGLDIQFAGVNFQVVDPGLEEDLQLRIPPIPGLLVLPGRIGFLNQFFTVQLFTANAAPQGSGLSVYDIDATLNLPPGADLIVAESWDTPGDDPLRFARVGEEAAIEPLQRVASVGADGEYGTADDVQRLQPGDCGRAEFLVEGLKEGLHLLDIDITARLDGFAAGIEEITGGANGAVLVRNPNFSLAFAHPRTVRAGEPYQASVTVMNTALATANLVSVSLNPASISGAALVGDATVELGTIESGESATATFDLVAQRTGAITFSNITGDDNVSGVFWLRMGVDERGVQLSPDALNYPNYVDDLPDDVFAAADRVMGQAISVATAPRLPPGVRYLSTDTVAVKAVELAEAGQRMRYGDTLERVATDLLIDWMGERYNSTGFDQLMRTTDAGANFGAALLQAAQAEDSLDAAARLTGLARDLAGRGAARLHAAASTSSLVVTLQQGERSAKSEESSIPNAFVADGGLGSWLNAPVASEQTLTWTTDDALTSETVTVVVLNDDGTGEQRTWTITSPSGGACFGHDTATTDLTVDDGCNGTLDSTLAAVVTPITELPPEFLSVQQDLSVHAGRPSDPCLSPVTDGRPVFNYATVVAVLFSKPMTQEDVAVPSAYTLDNGDAAGSVQIQPGGRVALLNLRRGVGDLVTREMTIEDVTDPRGNPLVSATRTVTTSIDSGVRIDGTVRRANGELAANVPVTLTMYDQQNLVATCDVFVVRVSQVYTDEDGAFDFDMVLAGIPYSISATDTFGLPEETVESILAAMSGDGLALSKLRSLAEQPGVLDDFYSAFGVDTLQDALNAITGLDRAMLRDGITVNSPRVGTTVPVSLRFRGRGTVIVNVLASDGVTPVPGAAVNLTPALDSRELPRGFFSDPTGEVVFPGVPLGHYSIDVQTSDNRYAIVDGSLEEVSEVDRVTIVLPDDPTPITDVTGFVYEADATTPHANATVYIGHLDEVGNLSAIGSAKSNPDGSYLITNVPAGIYDLVGLSHDGRRRIDLINYDIVADAIGYVNLVLRDVATVEGVVQFANGDPAAGALVTAGIEIVTADAAGVFTLVGVPTGSTAITAGMEAGPQPGEPGYLPGRDFPRLGSTTIEVLPSVTNPAVIRFDPVGKIYGTVRTANGDPVPNVKVSIPRTGGFAWVEADENGEYVFAPMGLDSYFVSAPAPFTAETDVTGILQTLSDADATDEEIQDAVLEAYEIFTGVNDPFINGTGLEFSPGEWGYTNTALTYDGQSIQADISYLPTGTVSGIVKNDKGTPIGARVRLTGVGPMQDGSLGFRIRGERDSDPALGTFEFPGALMVGSFGLQAATPFYPVVVQYDSQTTHAAPDATGIELVFPPDAEVNGRLTGTVYQPDGSPVGAGTQVAISFSDDYQILTIADGTFDTQLDLPAGAYQVVATDPATGLRGRSVAIVKAGEVTDISVQLLGLGDLEIIVVDAAAQRVPGASLTFRQGGFPSEDYAGGPTDPDGVWTLFDVFEGTYQVTASLVSGPTTIYGSGVANVVRGETTTLRVELQATGSIHGTFVEADQVTPVIGAQIRVGNLGFSTTDDQGRFQVDNVPLGTYELVGQQPVTGQWATRNVILATDGQIEDVLLVVRTLGDLTGSVASSYGDGFVTGAYVQATFEDPLTPTRTVTSDLDGAYRLVDVPPGRVTLHARDPLYDTTGSATTEIPEGGGDYELDIQLQSISDLTILVLDDLGIEQPNAEVIVSGITLVTGPDGVVEFPSLPLGDYLVRIEETAPSRSRNAVWETVTLAAQPSEAFELQLPGIGEVNGRVFDAGGTPLGADVEVEITFQAPLFNGDTESVLTDPNGDYLVANVPRGEVCVTARSGPLGATDCGVLDGLSLTIDLTLSRAGTVSGRVLREDGVTPAEGAEVVLTFDAPSGLLGAIPTVTDALGEYGFETVPADIPLTLDAQMPAVNGIRVVEVTLDDPTDPPELLVADIVLDEANPTVVESQPAHGDIDVPVASPVVLTFSEALDPDTIVASGVYLALDGDVVATSTLVGTTPEGATTITLQPDEPLESQVVYSMVVANGDLLDALGAVIASGPRDLVNRPLLTPFVATFTTADERPPVLLSFTPEDEAVQVDPTAVIRLSYDETIQPAGIVIEVEDSALQPVVGTVDVGIGAQVVIFTPAVFLSPNETYSVTVSGVEDLAGNLAVEQPYERSFATVDTLGPEIATLRLQDGVAPEAGSVVTLESTLAVAEAGARVTYYADLVQIGVSDVDDYAVEYTLPTAGTTVSITAIAVDEYGNEGERSAALELTTEANTPPSLALAGPAQIPSGGSFTVDVNASDAGGLDTVVYEVSGALTVAETPVAGNEIALTAPATAGAGESLLVTVTATDTAGEATVETASIAITDGVSPEVAIDSPTDGQLLALDTPVDLTVTATDAFGVTALNLRAEPAVVAPQTILIDPAETSATRVFSVTIPSSHESGSLTFVVEAQDASGRIDTASVDVTTPDEQPPTVVSTLPADGATDQAITVAPRFELSEPVDPATLTAATLFRTSGPGAPAAVAFSVGSVGPAVIFTPDDDLTPGREYTVTIGPPLADLAGNTIVGFQSFTFTTGIPAAPQVTGTSPDDGAEDVELTGPITVTFSAELDAGSLGGTSLVLRPASGPDIALVAGLGDETTLTLTPQDTLVDCEAYSVFGVLGAADPYGQDALDPDGQPLGTTPEELWSFTAGGNGCGPAPEPPMLWKSRPEDGSIGIRLAPIIRVYFTAALDPATVDGTTVVLEDEFGGTHALSAALIEDDKTMALFPLAPLTPDTEYDMVGYLTPADHWGQTAVDDDGEPMPAVPETLISFRTRGADGVGPYRYYGLPATSSDVLYVMGLTDDTEYNLVGLGDGPLTAGTLARWEVAGPIPLPNGGCGDGCEPPDCSDPAQCGGPMCCYGDGYCGDPGDCPLAVDCTDPAQCAHASCCLEPGYCGSAALCGGVDCTDPAQCGSMECCGDGAAACQNASCGAGGPGPPDCSDSTQSAAPLCCRDPAFTGDPADCGGAIDCTAADQCGHPDCCDVPGADCQNANCPSGPLAPDCTDPTQTAAPQCCGDPGYTGDPAACGGGGPDCTAADQCGSPGCCGSPGAACQNPGCSGPTTPDCTDPSQSAAPSCCGDPGYTGDPAACTGGAADCTAADQCGAPECCGAPGAACQNPACPGPFDPDCSDPTQSAAQMCCGDPAYTGDPAACGPTPADCEAVDQCGAFECCGNGDAACQNPACPGPVSGDCSDPTQSAAPMCCGDPSYSGDPANCVGTPADCAASDQCGAFECCGLVGAACQNPACPVGLTQDCSDPQQSAAPMCCGDPSYTGDPADCPGSPDCGAADQCGAAGCCGDPGAACQSPSCSSGPTTDCTDPGQCGGISCCVEDGFCGDPADCPSPPDCTAGNQSGHPSCCLSGDYSGPNPELCPALDCGPAEDCATAPYRLETNERVVAYAGPACSDCGGTHYYPTPDGTRVGQVFEVFVPHSVAASALRVLVYDAGTTVTVTDDMGAPVGAPQVFGSAPEAWTVPALTPLEGYTITAVGGDIAVVTVDETGFDVVPARGGQDAGTELLFATPVGGPVPGGFVVLAYEDADVTLTQLDGVDAGFEDSISFGGGDTFAVTAAADASLWHIASTGEVGVWAGAMAGSSDAGDLKDDAMIHQGVLGLELFVYSPSEPAQVIASHMLTKLYDDQGDVETVLFADDTWSLPVSNLAFVEASRPVVVAARHPNPSGDISDYGHFLRTDPAVDFGCTISAPATATASGTYDVTLTLVDAGGTPTTGVSADVTFETEDGPPLTVSVTDSTVLSGLDAGDAGVRLLVARPHDPGEVVGFGSCDMTVLVVP